MIRGLRSWMVVAAFALAPATGNADDGIACGERAPGDQRPRIGLALGGGGARGIAHISVIKGIEKAGIRVDCVAGTSMGSLVGGFYASGMPAAEIEELVLSLDWARMFNDSLDRAERSYRRKEEDRINLSTLGVGVNREGLAVATGVLAGQRILLLFERLTQPVSTIEHFDDLPIPYRAIATDLNTGEAAILDHGNLALAMRASMSLPGIFDPAVINGRVLLDGGLVNQVPIDVVRDMGAEVVIAVDVGTPLATLDGSASLLAVLGQMTSMMTVGNTRAQLRTLGERDVLVVPELGTEVTSADFDKGELALQIGDRAVAAIQDRLDALGDIAEVFAELVEADAGIVRAQVVTAIALPEDLEARLRKTLAGVTCKSVLLEKKIDPAVIGGVCVTLGDRIIDGTVRTNLDRLRKTLATAQVRG